MPRTTPGNTTNIILTGGLSSGYNTGDFGEYDKQIFGGDALNNLVTYTVTGGGRIYIERAATATRPATKKSSKTTLTTSSIFTVVSGPERKWKRWNRWALKYGNSNG